MIAAELITNGPWLLALLLLLIFADGTDPAPPEIPGQQALTGGAS